MMCPISGCLPNTPRWDMFFTVPGVGKPQRCSRPHLGLVPPPWWGWIFFCLPWPQSPQSPQSPQWNKFQLICVYLCDVHNLCKIRCFIFWIFHTTHCVKHEKCELCLLRLLQWWWRLRADVEDLALQWVLWSAERCAAHSDSVRWRSAAEKRKVWKILVEYHVIYRNESTKASWIYGTVFHISLCFGGLLWPRSENCSSPSSL